MYSDSGEVDFSDYTLNYYIEKSYLAGTEGFVYKVLFICWVLAFVFYAVVSLMVIHFEGRLYGRERLIEESFKLNAKLSDIKDIYTNGHSQAVARYAKMIAEQMGMEKTDCENVYLVAMVHDIGNYFVARELLSKNERLSKEEFEMVKTHTTKGAEMLEEMTSLPHVVEGALYHHERYDGSGYPMGIKGDEIPLIARIIAVADAFDAMNSERAYRGKIPREQIRQELEEKSGSQFDPVVVGVFLEIIGQIEE